MWLLGAGWLLAMRADALEEKVELLEPAMALLTAIKGDTIAAIDDRAKVADILAASSAHL